MHDKGFQKEKKKVYALNTHRIRQFCKQPKFVGTIVYLFCFFDAKNMFAKELKHSLFKRGEI